MALALKVGELYGVLRLDSDQFDRGLDDSGKRFEGLRKTIGAGVKAFATAFATTATAAGALGIAAVKVGINYNALRQTATAALTTLTGSAEAAADQMARLDEFGQDSWVMRDVLVQAQTQMMGFGIETEKVIPYLDALQEGVAAVGGSNEDFAELAFIMAQIEGQSKITAEELRMFGSRGIDAADLIGQAMGYTAEEIRGQITAGALDATDALDAMAESMMTNFEGATANVLKTWDGATSFIAAAWRDLGAELAKPLVDPTGGGHAVQWAMDFSDALYALRDQATPLVDLLVRRFTPGLDAVSPAIQRVVTAINDWDVSKVNRQLDEMGKYAPLIAGVSASLFALGSSSIPVLGRLLPAINPVVAGLAAMVAFSPELRAMGGDFMQALSPLVPIAKELGGLLADTLVDALHTLTPAVSDLLLAAADVAVVLGTSLAPALTNILTASAPLVDVLADVISWVAELPTPVLAAAAAAIALSGPLAPLATALGSAGLAMMQFGQRAQIHAALGRTNVAMGALSVATNGARVAVRALGAAFMSSLPTLAIAGVVTALTYFATSQAEAKRHVDELSDSLDRQTGAIGDNTEELVYNRLEQDGVVEAAVRAGIALDDLVQAAMDPASEAAGRLREQVAESNAELARVTKESPGNAAAIKGVTDTYEDLWLVSREVTGEQENMADAEVAAKHKREAGLGVTEDAADANKDLAAAVDGSTEAIKRGDDAVRALSDSLEELSGGTVDARKAELQLMDAVDAATEAAKGNTDGLDSNTQAGRDNERALLDIVTRANEAAIAVADSTGSQHKFTEALQQGRKDLIAAAEGFGLTRTEAEKYADEVMGIPDTTKTRAQFDDIQARNRIRELKRILAMPSVVITPEIRGQGGYYANRADGGIDEAGRHVPRIPQVATGGRNIMWQEDETIWESYISGKPSARQRNLAVMDETARRLGGMFVRPMANGGTTGRAPAPIAAQPLGPVSARIDPRDIQALGDYVVESARRIARGEINSQGKRIGAVVR